MEQYKSIKEYIGIISSQIRFKKARDSASQEIESHIIDLKEDYIKLGMEEIEAETKAVNEMGDAVDIGLRLDRIHRPKINMMLIFIVGVMLLMGVGLLYLTSLSDQEMKYYLNHQILFVVVGMVIMVLTYHIDYTIIGKYPIVIVSALFTLLMFTEFFGIAINGRMYFVSLGGVSISLYHISILMVPALVGVLYKLRGSGCKGIILFGVLCTVCNIIVAHSSITGALQLSITALVVLTWTIINEWFGADKKTQLLIVYIPIIILLSFTLIYIFLNQELFSRVIERAIPSGNTGAGWQTLFIRDIINNSKIIGKGTMPLVGNLSIDDTIYSSMARSEYALTYIIGRYGRVAGASVTAVFLALVLVMIRTVLKQKSQLGFAVSLACTTVVTLQGIFYICANLGFVLFNPMSLPFIGYGGGGLVTNMLIMGLILSVYTCGGYEKSSNIVNYESGIKHFIELKNGKLTIDFNIIRN